jgi:hypothetical protein
MTHPLLHRLSVPLLAVVVAACGSAAPSVLPSDSTAPVATSSAPTSTASPSPSIAPVPSTTPEPTSSPSPTTAPATEPTAEPSAAPSSAPVGVDGQTGRVALDDQALALTLPKGWRSFSMTQDDIEAILAALPEGTLPAGFADQVPSMVAAGLKLWAWDTTGDLGANCSVIAQPVTVPAAFLKSTATASVSVINGVSNVKYTDIKVDGKSALRVDYKYVLDVSGTSVSLLGTQVYIARPDNFVVVTVTIRKGSSTKDRDRIVNSLELLDR